MGHGGTGPLSLLKGLAESATRIRLAPGVLGKTHTVILGVIALWGIVLFRLSATAVWLDLALILGATIGTVVALVFCKQSRDYAVAHPALALMEGADITEYQKFEAESKKAQGPNAALVSDPTKPLSNSKPAPEREPDA